MATTSEYFINQFHNIEGNTVGERKKNLYSILKSTKLSPDETKLLIENLKPVNYLETVFHADVLIYLKETDALLELLKTGNEIYVSKIIKQPWFFQEVFTNVSANQLVEEILPTLSYSVKAKVLKKLMNCLPLHQIDDIFDILLQRYGVYFAMSMLPGCTVDKIENVLKMYSLTLPTGSLKLIHKKNSNLIKTYFHELNLGEPDKICDNNFYIYLAENDPTTFWEIFVNYKPKNCFKLGKKITKKVLPLAEQKIINEPKTYINYFNNDRVVRVLNKTGKFPELYKNLFPDEMMDLFSEERIINILKYYPEQKRYVLFKNTFQDIFLENIWDNPKFMMDYFLDSLGDKNLRTKWAQLKFKETNDIEYIKYYDIETSIALLKERINLTSTISVRSKLLVLLLRTCAINKNMTALEQVLQYFCERHRNEDSNVRAKFMDYFRQIFEKKVHIYTEVIWKYVVEIITIQLINQEYEIAYNAELIIKYIEYLYKKDEETRAENAIIKYFPSILHSYYIDNALKSLKNPNIEKKILLFACRSVENMKKTQGNENYYSRLLSWFGKFNKRNVEKIYFDENMLNVTKKCIENMEKWERYIIIPVISDVLSKSNLNNFEKELLRLLYEKEFINCDCLSSESSFLVKMLKYNPSAIMQYLSNTINVYLEVNLNKIRFWPNLRSYSHLGLDTVVKKCCLNNLLNNESRFVKWNSIVALSYFLNSDEYIEIMKNCNLIPTKNKFDAKNEEEITIIDLQKCIIKMLKNTTEPSQYLSLLIQQFCQGDFLQDALPPLYKAFYRLPEEALKPYLKILSEKKNMSIQKHAIVLACTVLDKSTSIQTLQMSKKSKNESFKKAVFSSALKYFCKNSSKEMFDIILELMKFLTEQNVETLNNLFTVKIDKKYKAEYLQNAWLLLESFKNNPEINNIKTICLKSFEGSLIKDLPINFCKDIVHNYFLSNERFQTSEEINQFVIIFLFSYDQEDNFAFVFNVMSKFKSKVWSNYKTSDRKEIYNFVKTFVKHAHKLDINLSMVLTFLKFWNTVFSPLEIFESYFLINLFKIWKENNDPVQFSNNISTYLKEINIKYGDIFSSVVYSFSEFLNIIDNNNLKLDILYNLLTTSSTLSYILVIEFLKFEKNIIREDRILKKYLKIDNKLKQLLNNDVVMLKYNSLLIQY